jgi:hypothetical protein
MTVRYLDRLHGLLKGNAIDALHRAGALVVPPISAFGATLIFEG